MTHQHALDLASSHTFLGIELGSTRIKAVLIGSDYQTIATGSYEWENQLKNGIWTYELQDAWKGIQSAYHQMSTAVVSEYGIHLKTIGAIGISGMMHGYLPFDQNGNQLTEFRTWRNTITQQAADELTKLFSFQIPQRWSIAHLYQAILNQETTIHKISTITTLAGYVHHQLTGEHVLGLGEASGVFPIDSTIGSYDETMMQKFDHILQQKQIPWRIHEILPAVKNAGELGGTLTLTGAKLLDQTGMLQPGIPLCPPEGDADTGMVATNSVGIRTGNISAGTSIFAMAVLEKPLSKQYPEIDLVTTPDGKPVAMVHCNTCTSDLDAWVKLFGEMLQLTGMEITKSKLYELLYNQALKGHEDCNGMVSFNYYAGETITGLSTGCPMFAHPANTEMTLADFMRTHLYSAIATLKIGMELLEQEGVILTRMLGHGGLFKTPVVAQKIMAGALNLPISTMETAGEGGPWGMAVLASYMLQKQENESLDSYLNQKVFAQTSLSVIEPDQATVKGFSKFLNRYKQCIEAEQKLANIFEQEDHYEEKL